MIRMSKGIERAFKYLMHNNADENSISSFTVDDVLGQPADFLFQDDRRKMKVAKYVRKEIEAERAIRKQNTLRQHDSQLLTLIENGDYAACYFREHFWKYGTDDLEFKIVTNPEQRIFTAIIRDLKTKKMVFENKGMMGMPPVFDIHLKRKRTGIINRFMKITLINYQNKE